ncbi:hypothetical protein HG531_008112 [Fusarium graminearum]|nr:hypothetical protein HG531_008112 [Fusarium graminearum]
MRGHHVVLVCQVRDLGHLPHGVTVDNIATASMGKRLAFEHRDTSDIRSLCAIDPVAKVPHQVRPEDVGVGLGEHVPLFIGAHLPGFLNHMEEFVLIKIPAILTSQAGGAILLRDWAINLCLVKVKLFSASPDIVLDILENIVDLVLVNLLVLSELVSCITHGTVA